MAMTHDEMHAKAEEVFASYDFGSDIVADSDGWEWDSGEPTVFVRTVYFENTDGGDSIAMRFSVDFREVPPDVAVY